MTVLQPVPDMSRRRRGSGPSATVVTAGGSRVPPHNFDAEESVLGAMLLSRDAIAVVVEQVGAEDFYKPSHAHIYEAITSLYARGEPADFVTVPEELRRVGVLDASGGAAALIALQANTPAISSANRYARIVQEHALLRRLIGVAHEIAEIGYEVPTDVAGALDQAEALVFDVAQRRTSDTVRSLKDLLTESLERLDHLYDRGETITGVPTGYGELDYLLSGLQPSNLIVVGARPSMGKTAFALGLAANAASNHGVPVLFFSLEMSHLEIAQRVLAAEARLDVTKLRNGRLLDSDWPRISSAIGRIDMAPLFIDDNPNVTIMDIRAKARRMRSSDGIGLVVIDYLQLMTGRSSAENRQVEISEISRGLKILARELQLPVVALSQLSRGLEARADKRPMLADLRESGAIEQDADVVMFIYRDEVYNPESADRGTAEVLVAKHRNGPTGSAHLAFIANYAKFGDLARV
ncbi:MAG: replicative DNA helicase [Acidimicrobiales bacterium]|jgi:replicative DNA helicase